MTSVNDNVQREDRDEIDVGYLKLHSTKVKQFFKD